METEKFMKVNYNIASDNTLSWNEKAIIIFLKSYQDNGNYYYGSQEEMSVILGIKHLKTLKNNLKSLKEKNLIFISTDIEINGKKFKAFNNKKVIVLVDKNNPLPSSNEEKSDEVYESITSTEEVDEIERYLASKI